MTVNELIQTLKALPPKLEVYHENGAALEEVVHFTPDELEQEGGWTERVELYFS